MGKITGFRWLLDPDSVIQLKVHEKLHLRFIFQIRKCMEPYSILKKCCPIVARPSLANNAHLIFGPQGISQTSTFSRAVWSCAAAEQKWISMRVVSAFWTFTTKSPEAPGTLAGHAPDTPRTCSQDPWHCPDTPRTRPGHVFFALFFVCWRFLALWARFF